MNLTCFQPDFPIAHEADFRLLQILLLWIALSPATIKETNNESQHQERMKNLHLVRSNKQWRNKYDALKDIIIIIRVERSGDVHVGRERRRRQRRRLYVSPKAKEMLRFNFIHVIWFARQTRNFVAHECEKDDKGKYSWESLKLRM